jgi:hypothetical protein
VVPHGLAERFEGCRFDIAATATAPAAVESATKRNAMRRVYQAVEIGLLVSARGNSVSPRMS